MPTPAADQLRRCPGRPSRTRAGWKEKTQLHKSRLGFRGNQGLPIQTVTCLAFSGANRGVTGKTSPGRRAERSGIRRHRLLMSCDVAGKRRQWRFGRQLSCLECSVGNFPVGSKVVCWLRLGRTDCESHRRMACHTHESPRETQEIALHPIELHRKVHRSETATFGWLAVGDATRSPGF